MGAERSAAVYVHFPFCLQKCRYCDFSSRAVRRDLVPHDAYASAILREWAVRASGVHRYRAQSLFFGGGTPSLWLPGQVERIIQAIVGDEVLEVSLEANPCVFGASEAAGFRQAGVSRLSLGVQSLDDARLRMLGRVHDSRQSLEALRCAKAAGFRTCSADLIFGLPGERVEEAVLEARRIAEEGVEHMSAYALTLAEGTPLYEAVRSGRTGEPDDAEVAEAFLAVSEELTSRGYEHYEVSNFARPGHRCEHHGWVWGGGAYVGLGAGAVGCVAHEGGRTVRYRNRRDAGEYQRAVWMEAGGAWWEQVEEETEELTAEMRFAERVLLGLRQADGVDLGAVAAELGVQGWTRSRERRAAELQRRGRLEREGGRVRIPRRAWLWENDTAAGLI